MCKICFRKRAHPTYSKPRLCYGFRNDWWEQKLLMQSVPIHCPAKIDLFYFNQLEAKNVHYMYIVLTCYVGEIFRIVEVNN